MKTIEQKAAAYDKAVEKIKYVMELGAHPVLNREDVLQLFPQLQEPDDEKLREQVVYAINQLHVCECTKTKLLAWLEKQGEQTSWKPSKEEMDVLYGLAYITDQYDEHKEDVITRLYQDLKREFFNGSSYENMFSNTEDDVRRRSTIQVLEYARSLDTYNQYGKADIDKNIAWLEKQGENKPVEEYNITGIGSKNAQGKLGEMLNSADKIEPKFKIGDWVVTDKNNVVQIKAIQNGQYVLESTMRFSVNYVDKCWRKWDISDAKDGDVLATDSGRPFIFKGCLDEGHANSPVAYCGIDIMHRFRVSSGDNWWTDGNVHPATKEQHDLLFTKMKEAGYKLDKNFNIVKI